MNKKCCSVSKLSLLYVCFSSFLEWYRKYQVEMKLPAPQNPMGSLTVFVRSYNNRIRNGSVSYEGSGEHPYSVLGPLAEFVDDKLACVRILDLEHRRFRIRTRAHDVEYFVVRDFAILLILWRGLPYHTQGGRGFGVGFNQIRRRARDLRRNKK